MTNEEQIYSELVEIRNNLQGQNGLSELDKKQFWKIVGRIKRQSDPSELSVQIASEIRDTLYTHRLGGVKSTDLIVILLVHQ